MKSYLVNNIHCVAIILTEFVNFSLRFVSKYAKFKTAMAPALIGQANLRICFINKAHMPVTVIFLFVNITVEKKD